MKINILSPHIDDAGYCLALTIAKCANSKMQITVINCFTVTKWAIRFVSKDINEISLLRKNEDIEFYKSYQFPINIVNLDLLDAPLRSGFIFQEKPFEEKEWQVVNSLKKYLENHLDGLLFCPLGLGNHVDHAICREAVLQLYDKMKVLFFEDLPYANRLGEAGILAHVHDLQTRLNAHLLNRTDGLHQCTINKEQAIRLYKTQLNDQICSEIIDHMNLLSGERIWGEAEVIEEFNDCLVCN